MSSTAPAEPAAPTGAVVASPPDVAAKAAGSAGAAQPSARDTIRCANCGTPLTGKYCSECGQRHHDLPIYLFWHFVREATEDLTHADSRLWQTLIALLFRPGFLTREFLEGRRARYLPPVRLYLVVSVIFFIVTGLQSRMSNPQVILVENGKSSFSYQVIPADGTSAIGAAARTPASVAGRPAAVGASAAAQQALCEQIASFVGQHGGWFASLRPRVMQSCLAYFAKGGLERLNDAVSRNLERAMFLFLPLLALVMKPLYRKPPRHYVEHLLFFLHDHAFLFVVVGASSALMMITSSALVLDPVKTAIAIYIPIYFYRAMRRVYEQGRWLTLSKLAALGLAYVFLGVVMALATLAYSFLTL